MKNYSKPWIPRGIYKITSPNNKVQFWALFFGCFATIFTFWMGIAYQYVFVDVNNQEAKKDNHLTIVDNYAIFKRLFDSKCSPILTDLLIAGGNYLLEDEQTAKESIKKDVKTNWDTVMNDLQASVDISEKAKYYFDKEKYDIITKNNTRIHYVVEYYFKSLKRDEVTTYDNFGFILRNISKDTLVNKMISSDLVKFGDELHLAHQSLINSASGKMSIPSGDKVMGNWSAMEAIYKDKRKRGQFISKDSEELLYQMRFNLLLDLGPLLAENFRIINDEVAPIREDGNINTNYLFTGNGLKNMKVSPGVIRTVMFFIICMVLGVMVWWIVIRMVFNKAETDNPNSIEEWEKLDGLKNELAITEILIELYEPQK